MCLCLCVSVHEELEYLRFDAYHDGDVYEKIVQTIKKKGGGGGEGGWRITWCIKVEIILIERSCGTVLWSCKIVGNQSGSLTFSLQPCRIACQPSGSKLSMVACELSALSHSE